MDIVIGQPVKRQVAFVGPYGVGKTTAVRAISETPVVNTDVTSYVSLRTWSQTATKRTTTAGLDYGEWTAPGPETIAVVGTPGQARFVTVRRSAMVRVVGVVLWLFGDRPYSLEEAAEWMNYIGGEQWPRLTVAVTRIGDLPSAPTLAAYRPLVDEYGPDIPLLAADPRDPRSVAQVLCAALRLAPLAVAAP